MDKILIASDIHGSARHCQKLINAFYDENAETLLLLGDILDGDREVAAMLNELDLGLGSGLGGGGSESPYIAAAATMPTMPITTAIKISPHKK